MKKALTLLLITIFASTLFSQTVLMEEDVAGDTIPETFGPNLKQYRHLYFEYGFLIDQPEEDGLEIKYGNSSNLVFGMRYKYKMTKWFAIGWDVHLSSWVYRIKQDTSKIFPNNIQHDKEKLTISNAGLEFYTRFNFGRRGNQIGKFVDLAGFGNFRTGATHFTLDKLDAVNINNADKVKTSNTGLIYLEDINYGAKVRLGINRYVLTATYRISDIIKDPPFNTYPELPRLFVGFQIGLH